MLRRIGRVIFNLIPRWTWRVLVYAVFGSALLAGGLILGLRYWVLPNAQSYRADVERVLSEAIGQQVRIGELAGDWQGLRPQLVAKDVRILDAAGEPALALERVEHVLSWTSLLHAELRLHAVSINRPDLALRRDRDGRLWLGAIALDQGEGGGGLSDWLLRQRQIIIRNARLAWRDELLDAPELTLDKVQVRLYNEGDRHRFGLQATPPANVAAPVDVRADLTGSSVAELANWSGTFYVSVEYVDIAAWRRWVPFPVDVPHGAGALRMWVDVAREEVRQVIADLRLSAVRARLRPDLPELELASLSGRLGWKSWSNGFELTTQQLSLTTHGGLTHAPLDLYLRRHQPTRDPLPRGELRANVLALEPLAVLAEHLPIDEALRRDLARFDPRGFVHDLDARWSGEWPPRDYRGRARFDGIGITAGDRLPGFTNGQGTIEASEKGGTVVLANRKSVATLPRVFAEPVKLDELTGQISWGFPSGQLEVRLANVSFANEDLAGTVQGTWRAAAKGPGVIDLTGQLARADAEDVPRYLPLVVGKRTREWLTRALVAGRASDVKLKLKGDLVDFPFADGRRGTFQVAARLANAVLDYDEGWPRIEGAFADLLFEGTRMEIRSNQATMLGARVTRARVVMPDLLHPEDLIEINGEAEGSGTDLLRFVAESPVRRLIDGFTDGMQMQGRGRVSLAIVLPIRRASETRVNGSLQFQGNTVVVEPDVPAFEQVNGRLEFTESGVRLPGITAQFLGGPVTLSGTTEADGTIRVTGQGRATLDGVRKGLPELPLASYFSGATDWQGTFTLRRKAGAELVIESGLQGVASTLPPPVAKNAQEAVPLRIERRFGGAPTDSYRIAWGQGVTAHVIRRFDGRSMTIERAAIGLGTPAPAADRPGLWIGGNLAALDADRWRAVIFAGGRGGGLAIPPVAGIDVRVAALDLFGRRFHDLALKGQERSGRWQASIAAREVTGELAWRSEGRGQLLARLRHFTLPPPIARAGVETPAAAADLPSDYPAIDLTIEDFRHGNRALGVLEVFAVPDGRDWRVERLRLANPDAILQADGAWQWRAREPRTQMSVRLEINDIGRYFARMGYPEGVRGGTAKLDGTVVWSGPPQDIDFPSLSGSLVLEAAKGQFLRVDPGLGKLLSILSLQALPRRIALDFRDVFSEGFQFDEIHGAIKISRGVASADNFRINGSSARVVMSGDVDLVRETQKLRVRVTPSVGDSVSTVTTILGGPIAGIGVFLAQRLLKDPFGQLIAHEYTVGGTWTDPVVARASPPPTGTEAGAPESGR